MNLITRNLVAVVSKLFPNGVFYKETSSKIISLKIDDVNDLESQFLLVFLH